MSDKKLLFRYLNSINWSKEDFLLDKNTEEYLRFDQEYKPYVVTQLLSGAIDTLMLSNITNTVKMSPRAHYLFLLYSVRRRKRYLQYPKSKPNQDIDVVARYYSVSHKVAAQYLKLLNDSQLSDIKKDMSDGGL